MCCSPTDAFPSWKEATNFSFAPAAMALSSKALKCPSFFPYPRKIVYGTLHAGSGMKLSLAI